jgi:hypothetical protein
MKRQRWGNLPPRRFEEHEADGEGWWNREWTRTNANGWHSGIHNVLKTYLALGR